MMILSGCLLQNMRIYFQYAKFLFLNHFKYLVAICLTVLGVGGAMTDGFIPQYVFQFLEEINILNELCTGFSHHPCSLEGSVVNYQVPNYFISHCICQLLVYELKVICSFKKTGICVRCAVFHLHSGTQTSICV